MASNGKSSPPSHKPSAPGTSVNRAPPNSNAGPTAGSNNLKAALDTYHNNRKTALTNEFNMGFEAAMMNAAERRGATDLELKADKILQRIKQHDIDTYYKGSEFDSLGQAHPRFYGDHFLHNVKIIEQTNLFKLCHEMPKGAHLHIHFNANCHPSFLLGIAKDMEHMYIWSSRALTDKEAFQQCTIQFSILSEQKFKEKNPSGKKSIFSSDYKKCYEGRGDIGWMSYKQFRAEFRQHTKEGVEKDVDKWLLNKLMFNAEEAYNSRQCAAGAWELFNGRTKMMKGLFNYETAFVRYIQACLREFARDNIQYAEIRPNFMSTNQLWDDKGEKQMDNEQIMQLIIKGYETFQSTHKKEVFKGLKVIYCTPRSFSKEQVKFALNQCIEFKKKFPNFIAGFDLVGEEGNGKKHPLQYFAEEFLEFRSKCKAEKLDIPFLFHCGETLENGTDTDRNLIDAILFGAKRIAHGYAVPWHPWVMQQLKARNMCIELCPISNEILGLTPRIGGHSLYTILANNVPACVSTDNGGLFRSTLAHDFYQVMAGKRDMTLFGLRQLAYWSLEHSCMTNEEKKAVIKDWEAMWTTFVKRIAAGEFGGTSSSSSSQPASHTSGAAQQGSQSGSSGNSASQRNHPGNNGTNSGQHHNGGATGNSAHRNAPAVAGPGKPAAPQAKQNAGSGGAGGETRGGATPSKPAPQRRPTQNGGNGTPAASASSSTPQRPSSGNVNNSRSSNSNSQKNGPGGTRG